MCSKYFTMWEFRENDVDKKRHFHSVYLDAFLLIFYLQFYSTNIRKMAHASLHYVCTDLINFILLQIFFFK